MPAKRSFEEWVLLINQQNPSFFENNILIESESIEAGKLYAKCKVCGYERQQAGKSIIKGYGCNQCSYKVKASKISLDTSEFLKRLFERFPNNNDKFDYTKTHYTTAKSKVTITCLTCGKDFHQTPNCHLAGKGCSYCVGRNKTSDSFISEVLSKFPQNSDLYDYSKVEYVNDSTKVTIGCKSCGKDFTQQAGKHLIGRGCNLCKGAGFDKQLFVDKLISTHPNLSRLDFNNSQYKNYSTLIDITCSSCGDALHRLPATLFRTGRAGCSCEIIKSNINYDKGYLYLVKWVVDGKEFIKVGITSNKTYQRCYLTSTKLSGTFEYEILYSFEFDLRSAAMSLELDVKHKFSHILSYVDRDMFPDGWTETFHPRHLDEVVKFIQEQLSVQST